MNLILASKSPRRIKILASVGYDFTIVNTEFDEKSVDLTIDPVKGLEEIAMGKAASAYESLPAIPKLGSVVIGADTIVMCDGKIMLKPKDEAEARKMLNSLSGRKHEVYTSVALVSVTERDVFTEKTDVYFFDLTEEEIEKYIKTGEPMDKAGAYGIQGRGATLVERIEGDYLNVVGLPIAKVARALKNHDIELKLKEI
ncbi:MAG: septum formation protein Maf [Ruminococcaceae bacterium]|nr:septum formation protein Maf [Oscillospiraceae bacterium]